MRFTIAAVATLCAFAFGADARKAQSVLFSTDIPCEMELQDMFTSFMKQYSKAYSYSEISGRYNQFKENVELIRQHNIQENQTFTMGINQFSDLSLEEFSSKYLGYKRVARKHLHNVHQEVEAAPASIDWRSQGAVTPIKDQGQCGSCWAFSATGAIEGAWKLAGNALVSLSEQQLNDCSDAEGNQGCNGGLMDNAFEYVIKNNGIASEAAYPYIGKDATCNKKATSVVEISSYTDVTPNSESSLLNAAGTVGPVSVAIAAGTNYFQSYNGGILNSPLLCGTALDHGVLVVGYGTDSGTDYWLVKNSWGTSWGESGYFRLIRNKDMCGIATEPSYPVI